jgi:MoaA/NifB/PqqE/SkfB family radical SAM enzyme
MQYDAKLERGESIAIMQFQYGYQCNMRCEHCCTSKMEKRRRHFTIPDVVELSRQADEYGLAHMTITGGEPLMFPDLDDLIRAVDPMKFFISIDSNGWYLDQEKANHLVSMGIGKVHLSLDSADPAIHDAFRNKPGSWQRVIDAIGFCKKAGMSILLNTIVTKERLYTQEFVDYLEFTKSLGGVRVVLLIAKPTGEWEGREDIILTCKDLAYLRTFEARYDAFTHLMPQYGRDIGCIAMKRLLSITKYGDVMPCPWIHVSIGNFFEEPLKDILDRGLRIKWFGERQDTCICSVKGPFLDKYMSRTVGKAFPVPWQEVFTREDFTR